MCRSVPYLLLTIRIFLPLLHSKVFLLYLFRSFQFFALNDRVLISLVELTLEVRCLNCRLDWNPELFSTSSRASIWQKGIGERRVEQSRAERGCVISFWALCNGWVGVSISSRLRKVPRGCYSFVTSQKERLTMRLIQGRHWRPGAEDFALLLRAWPLAAFIINKGKMKTKEPPSRSIPYLLTACTRQLEILRRARLS